jgi:hypothetical protein
MPPKERIDVLNPATDDWIVCVIEYDRVNSIITVTDARDSTVSSSFALVRKKKKTKKTKKTKKKNKKERKIFIFFSFFVELKFSFSARNRIGATRHSLCSASGAQVQ